MAQKTNVVRLAPERGARVKPERGARLKGERKPTPPQRNWLRLGLEQPGGKLPLFDAGGQRVNERTIRSCLDQGWAAPWFKNPVKPDWLVCKLTDTGRDLVS